MRARGAKGGFSLAQAQVLNIPERNQLMPEDEGGNEAEVDALASVVCIECGAGDDDEYLLLCDGA